MSGDSVAVLREIADETRKLAGVVADYGVSGMQGKARVDAIASRIDAAIAALSAHGVAEHGIERASKETLVACDCGCGRSCCANCGTDLGYTAPGGVGDAVTEALLDALTTVNRLHNLGDAVYDVRERADMSGIEGSSWDHPDVKAYSDAVGVIDAALAARTGKGEANGR